MDKMMRYVADGFEGQRMVRIPAETLHRARSLPIVRDLYVTDLGHFPESHHHFIDRPDGSPNHIFIYNARGLGWARIARRRIEIPAEHALLIPAGTPHAYGASPEVPWAIYWFHFNGRQAKAIFDLLQPAAADRTLFVPDSEIIAGAFEDVLRWTGHGFSDGDLFALSAALLRCFSLVNLHRRAPNDKTRHAEQRIQHTIQLMHQNPGQPRTLAQWARTAGLSVPHFCATFRRQTGCAPIRFHVRLRLQKACQLLDLTDMTINEVAREVGFVDPLYFTRQFKQAIGMPPSRYRRAMKG